jgi:hypothetical protein
VNTRLLALAMLAACARERESILGARPAYRTAASSAIGRIDGRLAVPDGADPADFIVWLDGVRAGKPLPLARRYELDHARGAFVPRAQAALARGALLVRSLDDRHFRVTFRDAASDSVLAIVDETGAGQVVPTARPLARDGTVIASSDERPAARAWIYVFDQPYFAQPDSAARFALDSVPAGAWRLRVWHPRLGERETLVTVDSAGVAFADVSY